MTIFFSFIAHCIEKFTMWIHPQCNFQMTSPYGRHAIHSTVLAMGLTGHPHLCLQSVLNSVYARSRIICITFQQSSDSHEAGVGSILLASLGRNSVTAFQNIVIQVVWKNVRLLHLSLPLYLGFRDCDRHFSARGHFRERILPLAAFKGRCAFMSLQLVIAGQQWWTTRKEKLIL